MKACKKSYLLKGLMAAALGWALLGSSQAQASEVFHETFDGLALATYAAGTTGNVGAGVPGDQTDVPGWVYTVPAGSSEMQIMDSGAPYNKHPQTTATGSIDWLNLPLPTSFDIDSVLSVTIKATYRFTNPGGVGANQSCNVYLFNYALGQSGTTPGYMNSLSAQTTNPNVRVNTYSGTGSNKGVSTSGQIGTYTYVITTKYTKHGTGPSATTTVDWSVTSPDGGVALDGQGGTWTFTTPPIPDGLVLDYVRIVWTAAGLVWIDDLSLEIETPGPEAEVKDGSTAIADGGGPVDFGSALVGGAALSKTFTVNNLGTINAMTTSNLSVPAGYSITEGLSASIPASGSDTFTVELPTTTPGTFTGEISFENNDSDKSPYNFSVTGTISPVGPEVEVKDGATDIANGGGPIDFGSALLGAATLSKTFTVNNRGTTALTTSNLAVPAGYTILEGLSASIPASDSDTFTVELPTTAGGTFSGDISFDNNDGDEAPFHFSVTGTITTVSRAKEWSRFD